MVLSPHRYIAAGRDCREASHAVVDGFRDLQRLGLRRCRLHRLRWRGRSTPTALCFSRMAAKRASSLSRSLFLSDHSQMYGSQKSTRIGYSSFCSDYGADSLRAYVQRLLHQHCQHQHAEDVHGGGGPVGELSVELRHTSIERLRICRRRGTPRRRAKRPRCRRTFAGT